MKKLYTPILVVAMAVTLLGGCGTKAKTESKDTDTSKAKAETISVTHDLGTTEVPVNPKKVAVFDYSVLDTMDALGVDADIIVPQADLPSYLEKYKEEPYKDAGDLKEPNVEAISEFKPDLIIIGGRQADLYSEFSDIAPTIYTELDTKTFWEDFENINLTVGEIFGKKADAEKKIADAKEKANEIKGLSDTSENKALIILTNDGSLSAYGPGSRFGIIHDVLGIKPVDDTIEVSTHGMEIGFEYIAEKNPDYLFVVDRTVVVGGTNLASQTLENDLVKTTNAGKNNKIVYLDPGTWYLSGYGLESVPKMLDEVMTAIK